MKLFCRENHNQPTVSSVLITLTYTQWEMLCGYAASDYHDYHDWVLEKGVLQPDKRISLRVYPGRNWMIRRAVELAGWEAIT